MKVRLLALLVVLTAGCADAHNNAVAYVGATLIDGTGAAAIPDAVLVVDAGRVTDVGPAAEVRVPRGATEVDVSGRFIMPGL